MQNKLKKESTNITITIIILIICAAIAAMGMLNYLEKSAQPVIANPDQGFGSVGEMKK